MVLMHHAVKRLNQIVNFFALRPTPAPLVISAFLVSIATSSIALPILIRSSVKWRYLNS